MGPEHVFDNNSYFSAKKSEKEGKKSVKKKMKEKESLLLITIIILYSIQGIVCALPKYTNTKTNF